MIIRKYIPGDEDSILELFHIVFKQEMTKNYWNWRFKNNPFSNEIFIYLMWDEDKLVGHYAVSPVEMNAQGNIVKTALSMTTMTHPEYGGQGIFSKLASALYQDVQENFGYKLIWGFPNNNSHYGFIKNLGWKDAAIIPMMTLELPVKALSDQQEIKYEVNDSFSSEIISKLNIANSALKINKTKNYLDWRYLTNPGATYKVLHIENLEGVVVYKVIKSFDKHTEGFEIDILELYFDNNIGSLSKIIQAILIQERNQTITKINIWKSIFTSERIWLEKFGFKVGLPLTYLSYLNLDDFSLASDYRNWDVGLGYSDVF